MGREVRHVPADWQHPRDERGRYIPLHEDDFQSELADYQKEAAQWAKGLVKHYGTGGWTPVDPEYARMSYEEYSGPAPVAENYMPTWTDAEKTHLMMYENTSEGTPISPAFATPEELARWLADNNASVFADRTASYEQWLSSIQSGQGMVVRIAPNIIVI